jgi:hypothetical protein
MSQRPSSQDDETKFRQTGGELIMSDHTNTMNRRKFIRGTVAATLAAAAGAASVSLASNQLPAM